MEWTRIDDEVGDEGWDSKMICHSFIPDCMGERYVFSNGNGYGKSCFGFARLIGE
jgi:hypothetical protein